MFTIIILHVCFADCSHASVLSLGHVVVRNITEQGQRNKWNLFFPALASLSARKHLTREDDVGQMVLQYVVSAEPGDARCHH